jgi:hypothetical protein
MASGTRATHAHVRRFPGWRGLLWQAVVVVAAVLAYFGVRGLTQSDAATAEANARDVVALERALGLDVEASLQEAIVHQDTIVTLANWVYIYGHWPVVALSLGVLFATAPDRFRLLRNAMFASGAIGLVIFALYPVAPPRFGVLDVLDTVTDRSSSYRTLQPPGLINRYAAVPSLHFGWNLLVGIVLWRTTRNPAVRAFALAMPVLMAWAVVVTGNHYVVDVIAGGLVALAGLAIARALPDDLPAALRRGRAA